VRPAPLVVIGAGGHASEVCAYVGDLVKAGEPIRLLGCIDDHKPAGSHGGLDVLGDFAALAALARDEGDVWCLAAVGDNATRRRFVERADAAGGGHVRWWTLRHPAAVVGRDAVIGPGACLAPGAIVTARVRLGAHVILNVNASVSHDAVVGDFVNINPGAVVAGGAVLGDACFIGAGATLIERIRIGAGTIVGAGAAVIRDLPPHTTAVGVPARVIKSHA
jgi:sugar O-acyltransferase (sialic acid O-acetyltransferase NeuD family)